MCDNQSVPGVPWSPLHIQYIRGRRTGYVCNRGLKQPVQILAKENPKEIFRI